jgi:hypothetical protein
VVVPASCFDLWLLLVAVVVAATFNGLWVVVVVQRF